MPPSRSKGKAKGGDPFVYRPERVKYKDRHHRVEETRCPCKLCISDNNPDKMVSDATCRRHMANKKNLLPSHEVPLWRMYVPEKFRGQRKYTIIPPKFFGLKPHDFLQGNNNRNNADNIQKGPEVINNDRVIYENDSTNSSKEGESSSIVSKSTANDERPSNLYSQTGTVETAENASRHVIVATSKNLAVDNRASLDIKIKSLEKHDPDTSKPIRAHEDEITLKDSIPHHHNIKIEEVEQDPLNQPTSNKKCHDSKLLEVEYAAAAALMNIIKSDE